MATECSHLTLSLLCYLEFVRVSFLMTVTEQVNTGADLVIWGLKANLVIGALPCTVLIHF